jgi:hypothetical protein
LIVNSISPILDTKPLVKNGICKEHKATQGNTAKPVRTVEREDTEEREEQEDTEER